MCEICEEHNGFIDPNTGCKYSSSISPSGCKIVKIGTGQEKIVAKHLAPTTENTLSTPYTRNFKHKPTPPA